MAGIPLELITEIISIDWRLFWTLQLVNKELHEHLNTSHAASLSGVPFAAVRGEIGSAPCIEYVLFNQLHRGGDLPAVIWTDGTCEWYRYGKRHRDNDMPAIVNPVCQTWCQNGTIHRNHDLPAMIAADGRQWWLQHGWLHRDNNRPAYIMADGTEEYWVDGVCVRMAQPLAK